MGGGSQYFTLLAQTNDLCDCLKVINYLKFKTKKSVNNELFLRQILIKVDLPDLKFKSILSYFSFF
jgi:hypothetical protein